MPALPALTATGAAAGFDVELGDDRHDGRQVGLILHDLILVVQIDIAQRAFVERNIDDAVDLVGCGDRTEVGGMALTAAGLLGFGGALLAAKGMGLAMAFGLALTELLAQFGEFRFQLSDAAVTLPTAVRRRTNRSQLKLPEQESESLAEIVLKCSVRDVPPSYAPTRGRRRIRALAENS